MGYKGPKIARFLHPSGYREVMIFNVEGLSTIDSNTQAARISHTVGKRKRALIIAEAKRLSIKILNLKVSKEIKEKTEEAAEGEAPEAEAEEQKEEKKPKKKPKEKAPKQTKTKSKKGEQKQ
jgi:hypothetical protein